MKPGSTFFVFPVDTKGLFDTSIHFAGNSADSQCVLMFSKNILLQWEEADRRHHTDTFEARVTGPQRDEDREMKARD